jgi:hypothetical protein
MFFIKSQAPLTRGLFLYIEKIPFKWLGFMHRRISSRSQCDPMLSMRALTGTPATRFHLKRIFSASSMPPRVASEGFRKDGLTPENPLPLLSEHTRCKTCSYHALLTYGPAGTDSQVMRKPDKNPTVYIFPARTTVAIPGEYVYYSKFSGRSQYPY